MPRRAGAEEAAPTGMPAGPGCPKGGSSCVCPPATLGGSGEPLVPAWEPRLCHTHHASPGLSFSDHMMEETDPRWGGVASPPAPSRHLTGHGRGWDCWPRAGHGPTCPLPLLKLSLAFPPHSAGTACWSLLASDRPGGMSREGALAEEGGGLARSMVCWCGGRISGRGPSLHTSLLLLCVQL